MAWIAASQPASWPTHTCKEPTDDMISLQTNATTAFPAMRLNTSSTKGIRRHARNASSVDD